MTTSFEIRVEGELSKPTLHRLKCAHCVATEQTMLRIEATPAALQELVNTCSQRGLTIERIVRVDAPLTAPGAARAGIPESAETQFATPPDRINPPVHGQLAQDPPHVGLHGVDRQEQLAGNLLG